jgi:hypothetical protein
MPFPLVAAGAALFGKDAAKAVGEIGNNSYRAQNFGGSNEYDASRYQYGGWEGGAHEAANRYATQGAQAQGRTGPTANYNQATYDRYQGQQARAGQAQFANQMAARAQGLVPSIAEMQAQRDMQQAVGAQASQAASARGGAGLALAQQNAANNMSNAQQGISGQAQINAAQERMAAEQAAFGAYSGMRGGDLASQGQSAQQAQYNAALQAQQRELNDRMTLGMTGYETGVQQNQLNANLAQQQILSGSQANAAGINAGINQNNANRGMEYLKMGAGMVSGAAGAAAGSDDRMKNGIRYLERREHGGPVESGVPLRRR